VAASAKVIVSPVCSVTCFEQEKVERIKTELAKEEQLLPQLAELYKLLGNVTRLKILLALAQGELCVCDVAHVLGISVAATSHQLKLLRDQAGSPCATTARWSITGCTARDC
jgi:hypothetical protein